MFSGEEEGRESEKRERVERGYGPEPRPGRAQSTRCKNANRPPPTRSSTKEKRERRREGMRGKQQGKTFKNAANQRQMTYWCYMCKCMKRTDVGDVRRAFPVFCLYCVPLASLPRLTSLFCAPGHPSVTHWPDNQPTTASSPAHSSASSLLSHSVQQLLEK